MRDGDLVGRFGGEEFVILLAARSDRTGADALVAVQVVADRIRRRVASLAVGLETPDGPLSVAGLSVSVGAAVCPDGHDDLRTLVHAADTALYAAKRAGRNRVSVGAVPAPGTEMGTEITAESGGVAGAESAEALPSSSHGPPPPPPTILVSAPPPLPPPT